MSVRGLTTCAVVPVFNEQETIVPCLKRVLSEPCLDFVNVVDDGSVDATWERLQRFTGDPRVRLLRQERNAGKGAALRRGFAESREDLIAVQDADLEYDPSDLPRLFEEVSARTDTVVYGSRYLGRDKHLHSSMAFYLGGQVVTLVSNLLFGTRLTDEPTCYKVFRREILAQMNLRCRRFEFCPEFTAKACLLGQTILEIPITYYPRHWDCGKKIKAWDGVEAIWELLYWRVRGRSSFFPG